MGKIVRLIFLISKISYIKKRGAKSKKGTMESISYVLINSLKSIKSTKNLQYHTNLRVYYHLKPYNKNNNNQTLPKILELSIDPQ